MGENKSHPTFFTHRIAVSIVFTVDAVNFHCKTYPAAAKPILWLKFIFITLGRYLINIVCIYFQFLSWLFSLLYSALIEFIFLGHFLNAVMQKKL
ncbi:hypothetical protein PL78_08980 [Yersinia entomophaga]|uniref:Uncharacterized protein n=1 Tax=Yersinia entomophaga TaxID=935293 RepID=A0ABM6BKB4_YERET|nr:hypothetical protein PL78_08980 [Yersinia entomophaga]OWF87417.1 hypothetical protein B4914_11585 [Yersinia entomophaga]